MLRIVLTGGPCAGKTRITKDIIEALKNKGYTTIICPETATELILGGIIPNKTISIKNFQKIVLKKQLAKENLYNEIAKYYDSNKLVIIYDRGLLDGCAYVDKNTVFKALLEKEHLTFEDIYKHYDIVFHLITTANGAEEFYQWNDPSKQTKCNNIARSENPEQAREKDLKTLAAWQGHPYLKICDNETDFDGKLQKVLNEIFKALKKQENRKILKIKHNNF